MGSGLVSVIVPVYKVEKYLDRCVTSIVNQSYRKLEIILVDDGSPDSCPQLCDQWAEKDSRIKVVHKENAGLGMARNTGMAHATGEFVCFLDSDDYIDERTVEKAYTLAQREKSDVVVFGFKRVDKHGKVIKETMPTAPKCSYAGAEVHSIFLPDLIACDVREANVKKLCFSTWSCLFSMELIEKAQWQFVSERQLISEDSYSLICLYKYVNRVSVLSEALYYYCENGASLSQSYRADRYERLKQFYRKTLQLAEELEYSAEISRRISSLFFSFSIGAMKQIVSVDLPRKERAMLLVQILDDEMMQAALKNATVHYLSPAKTIFYWAVRWKWYRLVFLLARIQNARRR